LLELDDASLSWRLADVLLDALVFSGNASPVRDVMVGGRWLVRDGRHPDRERIAGRYRRALATLL
jgi:formimidoylglutamate deiminase